MERPCWCGRACWFPKGLVGVAVAVADSAGTMCRQLALPHAIRACYAVGHRSDNQCSASLLGVADVMMKPRTK